MRLSHLITLRLSVVLFVVMTLWAVLFYFAIVDEVNDETDDSLEDYSELIIKRYLRGEELPLTNNGTNNTYWVQPVEESYVDDYPTVWFIDTMIYLMDKEETEPARMMKTIFPDHQAHYYELTVAIPTIEKEDLKNAILIWIVILYISLLVLVLLVNVGLLYLYMKPLRKLLQWLDRYSIGTSHLPLENKTDIYEFRRLNETAVASMKRSEEIFEEQKTFIGNASHEMQTPLAVAMNKIELLIDQDNMPESVMNELSNIHQTLEEAKKLNKTLLLLSKIENQQFIHKEMVNVNAIIHKYVVDYNDVFGYKNLQCTVSEEVDLVWTMNRDLALILFANVIRNAYTHNLQNGHITITITQKKVSIANPSSSEKLEEKEIFERFYQRNKKTGTTGIGLALVKAITLSEGLSCTYFYQNTQHIFEIKNLQSTTIHQNNSMSYR